MKTYTLLLFTLLLEFCFSQNKISMNTESNDSTNIYNKSFGIFIENFENSLKDLKNEDLKAYNSADFYFKDLYIIKSDFTSRSLNMKYSTRLHFIESEMDLIKIIKTSGRQKLLKIIPLRKDKESFFVNILLFDCGLLDDKLNMANLSGATFRYRYDCESNNFILISE